MRRTAWRRGLVVGVLVVLAGCASPGDDDSAASGGTSPPASVPTVPSPGGPSSPDAPPPLTVPPPATDPGEPAMPEPQPPRRSGAVPEEYLQRVIADAAQLSGLPADRFEVIRADAVQWPDSSLGCPKPGMAYLQVITDGYWVELAADGRRFDYRLDTRGNFQLCQRPMVGSPLYPDR